MHCFFNQSTAELFQNVDDAAKNSKKKEYENSAFLFQ